MENFLPELKFYTRTKTVRKSSDDVMLTVVTTNGKKKTAFTFRNGVADIIAPENSHIAVAQMKNRIFFKESEDGWLASCAGSSNPNTKYMRIALLENSDEFIGDYELKYDQYYELYYIEKEVK